VDARSAAINAVVMQLYDYGRKAIEHGLPDGPFRGVPFLLKDLGGWLAGAPNSVDLRLMPPGPCRREPTATLREHR
jgi:amidase